MQSNTHIFLIGLSGAGKTTIGQALAAKIGFTFADTDAWIETLTGQTIPQIFQTAGEGEFRRLETEAIKTLTSDEKPIVLATGGGAILLEKNRELLKTRGFVVYLQAPINTLLERTEQTLAHRPLLQQNNRREILEKMLEVREPLYLETADVTVSTEGKMVNSVIQEIEDRRIRFAVGES